MKKRLHMYYCKRCKVDFGVSDECEQVDVMCPLCLRDDEMLDYARTVEYRLTQTVGHRSLVPFVELAFGRPLSPLECEFIYQWIDQDQFDERLIKQALREALLSNVRNLRYVNRILQNWREQGIQTVEQARAYSQKFRRRPVQVSSEVESSYERKVPLYNWLEE